MFPLKIMSYQQIGACIYRVPLEFHNISKLAYIDLMQAGIKGHIILHSGQHLKYSANIF